ncbi:conserved membrane hypothetical protein [Hyella patelloides LEGE 07179]|uniref:Uncharacterized protein n=1 Tax=Hyella patelloides LEGE 07179 TaxID=945734 RepID=A0A563VM91_9CYAN|nr:DUF6220 domain-containing protein [Hyella patelloides]VEP12453.1 conserved membrane hypothetical protein [Hyella patelloides LEGE 07179]
MTINSELSGDRTSPNWIQISFYATSVIFNLCLIAQLLTVGIAYFNNPGWWNIHVSLVRGYSGLSLILLVVSAIAPFSNRIRSLAASLPVLLGLQFCSIHLKTPLHLEVFHPLIGFTLLYVSSSLVHRVFREVFKKKSDAVTESQI